MSRRTVEPAQLLFKEYTWYLRAFCRDKRAWRTFKLFRIKRLELLDETFVPKRDCAQEEEDSSRELTSADSCTVIDIWIDKKEAYRIYDRFEEEAIEILPDGNFMVHFQVSVDDWVYGHILNFGPSAEVVAPEEIRQEMKRRIQSMAERYDK